MARILYGVMGNTNGHIMRTLSIVPHLAEHKFHFAGGGRVLETIKKQYPVLDLPVLRTKYKNQKLDLAGTIGQILLRTLQIPLICYRLRKFAKNFKPDLIISDREFFTPIYALISGTPCISIDHTHILKACEYEVPDNLKKIYFLTMLNDYLLFDFTKRNLIVSFFTPPTKPGVSDEIFPAVVRPVVEKVRSKEGDHIFVYLSVPKFPTLIETLHKLDRKIIFYGAGKEGVERNITYRNFNEGQIFKDLASCRYAVVNGGHNLISEALYYGKPIMCFPLAGLIEQWINVHFIRKLAYGDYSFDRNPKPEHFENFETRLEEYRESIAKNFVHGTPLIVKRLKEIISEYET
ncbi:MAG: glycosyltransferase family protein [Verrucomicrobiota bacterium]